MRALMSRLRTLEIKFSLDDFGTGTSSLALLKMLDIDYLKVDGSFVRTCAINRTDAAILEAIHTLSRALDLEVVAEYASDEAVVEVLRTIGIDYAQGWAFSRAEPLENLTAMTPVGS